MPYATLVFRQSPNPNIFFFNSMIKGYSLRGPFHESITTFSKMKKPSIRPDEFTFAPLLKARSNLRDLNLGLEVYKELLVLGLKRYGAIRIGAVELFVNCGRMVYANKVFDEVPQRDVIVYNLMIRGFCKFGDVESGLGLFRRPKECCFLEHYDFVSRAKQEGRGCFKTLPRNVGPRELDIGMWAHSYAESSGLYRDFVQVGNAILDFYCKCGELDIALENFNNMPIKNVLSWNSMILGLGLNGKGDHGLELFEEMTGRYCLSPNDSTFVGVLACCIHGGRLQRGWDIFASMVTDYRLKPKLATDVWLIFLAVVVV
ncbi:hypothetical protein CASFOL_019720 [Castilleja foliolosa]|uniref:Pentatricopeptide repeat-containing protein n=1 Tax=Castilleja foliolosa TaxID=1961234 RepID=A0ABD3CYU0_9LAMI